MELRLNIYIMTHFLKESCSNLQYIIMAWYCKTIFFTYLWMVNMEYAPSSLLKRPSTTNQPNLQQKCFFQPQEKISYTFPKKTNFGGSIEKTITAPFRFLIPFLKELSSVFETIDYYSSRKQNYYNSRKKLKLFILNVF